MNRRNLLVSAFGGLLLSRTASSADDSVNGTSKFTVLPNGNIVLSWNFRQGSQGWLPGFSDYTLGMPLDATAEIRRIATGDSNFAESGYYFRARNASDDLFMFLKRPLGREQGVAANQNYRAHIGVQMFSNAPSGCFGAGGAPGEAVVVKAGVTVEEPATTLTGRFVTLNLDKGNQSVGGGDLIAAGNVANGDPCELPIPATFRQVWRVAYQNTVVRTGDDSQLWVTVGTDSGFEGITQLYYWTIGVVLIPV